MKWRGIACPSRTGLILLGMCLATNVWAGPPKPSAVTSPTPHLVVHEWGTFLSMQGSDGITLGGMVDSDEVLPAFVRERVLRGLNRSMIKMETPVTYFYPDGPMQVNVRVEMRRGMLTHWFPAVTSFAPTVEQQKAAKNKIEDSELLWADVQLVPDARGKHITLPPIAKDSIWRFARQTDSAIVRIPYLTALGSDVCEKFLFYRGLGHFDLPVEVQSTGTGVHTRLFIRNRGKEALPAVCLLNVDRGRLRLSTVTALPAGATREIGISSRLSAVPLATGVPEAKGAVAASLVRAGLYPKEARAMVNTWEKSYFRTDGLRVLYILPQPAVDRIIPLRIKPQPEKTVRIMLGRVELLTPDKERQIEEAVANLVSLSPQVRKAAHDALVGLGRFQKPALHRVVAKTRLSQVRAQAQALLAPKTAAKP